MPVGNPDVGDAVSVTTEVPDEAQIGVAAVVLVTLKVGHV